MSTHAMLERIYAAAEHAGLLTTVWAGAVQAQVNMRQPDVMVGGDLVSVEETAIEYPSGRLTLREGDLLGVVQPSGGTRRYRVSTAPLAFGDGSEMRAMLLPA